MSDWVTIASAVGTGVFAAQFAMKLIGNFERRQGARRQRAQDRINAEKNRDFFTRRDGGSLAAR